MLAWRDLPTAIDGDGVPRMFLQAGNRQVCAVRLRDPDDAMTSDQLKADWTEYAVRRGWGAAPMFYELSSGLLEAWYWTDLVLPQEDPARVEDWAYLDTIVSEAIGPGACINEKPNYATFSGDIVPELPPIALDLLRDRDQERNARRAEQDAQLSASVKNWNRMQAGVPTAPWPWIAEMNGRHAVTQHGGKTMVYEDAFDAELGHYRPKWTTFEDISNRYCHRLVDIPDATGKRTVTLGMGRAWLESSYRRQYDAEVFQPGKDTPPNILNLWRGFSVAPQRGRWHRFREHLRNTICDGDEAAFEYLLYWLARLVQRPGEPGQVAIVLKGQEGTGKGIFGRALVRLFGGHGTHLTQTRHLVGNFNAHLALKVFGFVDEAIFAGDPKIRGALFALITEDRMQLERKGIDAHEVANYLHIVMATNEDWAIPAGVNSRRFLVLEINPKHRQDTKHFAAIEAELASGGLAAMLFDLQEMNISAFNVFAVPQTAALAGQKIMSLKGPDRWLLDCLQSCRVGGEPWTEAGFFGSKRAAYEAYRLSTRDAREFAARDAATWARLCKAALGSCWDDRRPAGKGTRERKLVLSGVVQARAAFEKHFGHKIEWETDPELSAEEGADATALFN